jgi:hypothetical protein
MQSNDAGRAVTHDGVGIPNWLKNALILSRDPNTRSEVPGEPRRAIQKSVDHIKIVLQLEIAGLAMQPSEI